MLVTAGSAHWGIGAEWGKEDISSAEGWAGECVRSTDRRLVI